MEYVLLLFFCHFTPWPRTAYSSPPIRHPSRWVTLHPPPFTPHLSPLQVDERAPDGEGQGDAYVLCYRRAGRPQGKGGAW